mmetsp:Transcript_98429/g.175295  ORF Transcript_98429/g.175295 Transcript_98429/m.175295 type:complete len:100 (-) Transcript_98429:748-1047(-)
MCPPMHNYTVEKKETSCAQAGQCKFYYFVEVRASKQPSKLAALEMVMSFRRRRRRLSVSLADSRSSNTFSETTLYTAKSLIFCCVMSFNSVSTAACCEM